MAHSLSRHRAVISEGRSMAAPNSGYNAGTPGISMQQQGLAGANGQDHKNTQGKLDFSMKATLKILNFVFVALCLGYLLYAFISEGETIVEIFSAAESTLFLPAVLLWAIGPTISSLFANQLLSSIDCRLPYRQLLSIYLNRIPAKYLPGGVWQTFARAYDLNKLGLTKTQISILVFYENSWTVLIAALFSCLAITFFYPTSAYLNTSLALLAGGLLLVPVAVLLRRKALILDLNGYIRITLTGIAYWVVSGACFYLYIIAFSGVLNDPAPFRLIVNYMFSYVVGFIAIFAPQGIGVFEFIMTELTDFSIPQSQALVLLAGFRVVILTGDMIAWLLFLVSDRMYLSTSR